MTVDNVPESYQGLYYSRAAAEYAALGLQAEGRITKVEESTLHVGQWTVHATAASKPEDSSEKSSTVADTVQEPIASIPAELETTDRTDLLLHTYRNKAEAESAARKFQAEGRETRIEESQLHKNRWVVFSTKLEGE